MSLLLKCTFRQHMVPLDPDRFWQRIICPECGVPIDPTRLRRALQKLLPSFAKSSNTVRISNQGRFPQLKSRIDKLAADAWKSRESLYTQFLFDSSILQ